MSVAAPDQQVRQSSGRPRVQVRLSRPLVLAPQHRWATQSTWKWFLLRIKWLDPSPPIPGSQDYYWSEAWQEGEREAMKEYGRGEAVTFDCAEDAIRWLRED